MRMQLIVISSLPLHFALVVHYSSVVANCIVWVVRHAVLVLMYYIRLRHHVHTTCSSSLPATYSGWGLKEKTISSELSFKYVCSKILFLSHEWGHTFYACTHLTFYIYYMYRGILQSTHWFRLHTVHRLRSGWNAQKHVCAIMFTSYVVSYCVGGASFEWLRTINWCMYPYCVCTFAQFSFWGGVGWMKLETHWMYIVYIFALLLEKPPCIV